MVAKTLKLLSLAALVAAVSLPAGAGEFHAQYHTVRGVSISGPVEIPKVGTGNATVHIFEFDGGTLDNNIQILPLPTAPDPTTLQPGSSIVGCISMRVKSQVDSGCSIVNYLLDLDPTMTEATLTFSVESDVHDGTDLRVAVHLLGEGAPTPVVDTSDPGDFDPPTGIIQAQATLARSAAVTGAISSDGLGFNTEAGVVKAFFRRPTATMAYGVGASLDHGEGCILAVGLNCVIDG